MRLLVIDDNLELTDVISYYCKTQNIDCYITSDGKDGLTKIHEDNYDLILLDLAMPEFSGLDVLHSLKSEGLLEKINIVVFTASSDNRMFEEIRILGVKEILRKPCGVADLEQVINKYRSD